MAMGGRNIVRTIFFFGTWIFLIGLFVQVYIAGLGLFLSPSNFTVHVELGFILSHMLGPLLLILCFFCGLGRNLLITTASNFVLAAILPILAGVPAGFVAALHPVLAVVLIGLTGYVLIRVRELIPAPIGTATAMPSATTPTTGTSA